MGFRREKSRAGSKLYTFTTKYLGSSSFSKETKKKAFLIVGSPADSRYDSCCNCFSVIEDLASKELGCEER